MKKYEFVEGWLPEEFVRGVPTADGMRVRRKPA